MSRYPVPVSTFLALGLFASLSLAQSPAPPPPVGGITFGQVIRLSQSGLSDSVIIAQIKKRPQPFNLSAGELLQLKDAHVSEPVIEAMAGTPVSDVQTLGKVVSPNSSEQQALGTGGAETRASNPPAQQWASSKESDPLTGKSYMLYILSGKYLEAPANGGSNSPSISLRCDPAPYRRMSGRLIAGFIAVGTVIDLENGHESTVRYRLDDGKVQTATEGLEIGYSTDYSAIDIRDIFLNNLIWGHMLPHKPRSSGQVHKVVISVQEHLDGNVVMQFNLPEVQEVAAACGTEYKD